MALPMGAVALEWLRLDLTPLGGHLPQSPNSVGPEGLGFARAAFQELLASGIAPADLRVGASLSETRAVPPMTALADGARSIADLPANLTMVRPGTRVFAATALRPRSGDRLVVLAAQTMSMFGSIVLVGHIWRAMRSRCYLGWGDGRSKSDGRAYTRIADLRLSD